ncbi:hypothetical protein GCM10009414_28670 [Tatumella terrea]|uniref:hypothetical protein n=1 Tax=Tatumella terrea TaxID=419007 RepID=UPI0031DECC36
MTSNAIDIIDVLLKYSSGVITGICASVLTARFALSKFYQEKWWEKKHNSYGDLLDLLIEIRVLFTKASMHYERIHEAEQKLETDIDYSFDWEEFNRVSSKLRRLYVLAPISLGKNTKSHIDKFLKEEIETNRAVYEENYPEHIAYSEMSTEVEKLINLIVDDARKELRFK